MRHDIVLLDANVLYPAPLRDLLLQLAVSDFSKRNGLPIFTVSGLMRCLETNRTVIAPPLNARGL